MTNPDDQMKIHTNPYSKEGLGQQVMDMGVALAKLSTDMQWVKDTLKEIKERLDENNEEYGNMIKEYQAQVEERFKDHEKRIQDLEKHRSWMKGAVAGLSVVTFLLALVQLIHMIGG